MRLRSDMQGPIALVLGCILMGGCNLNRVAVDTTARILGTAEGSARAYFDWESAGYGATSGLVQLEGLHSVSPDNDDLTLTLMRAYMAYTYGWVMDAYEVAAQAGDDELAAHHQQRAYLMYSRARDLGMRVMASRDEHFAEHLHEDPKTLRAYLEKRFGEDDLPALFWLMMSWTSAINNSPNSEDLVDMSSLRVIAEWVIKRKPGYEDAGALVFLGGYESSMPKAVGGQPEKAKQYFDQALELTRRHNHIVLINYATLYAVAVQDRALYVATLNEILQAPDQGGPWRLSNKVARRRAVRALARTDELFF